MLFYPTRVTILSLVLFFLNIYILSSVERKIDKQIFTFQSEKKKKKVSRVLYNAQCRDVEDRTGFI